MTTSADPAALERPQTQPDTLDPANLPAIETYLRRHEPGDPRAAARSDALIDHILRRYHEVHLDDFAEAIGLARRVEAVHAADDDCPIGLADHLAFMAGDLACHQHKEEMALFPMMRQGGGPMLRAAIARMQAEHGDLVEQLERLNDLTREFTPPESACGTWRALNQLCRKLHDDLCEHMRLEDTVLFAHFAGAP